MEEMKRIFTEHGYAGFTDIKGYVKVNVGAISILPYEYPNEKDDSYRYPATYHNDRFRLVAQFDKKAKDRVQFDVNIDVIPFMQDDSRIKNVKAMGESNIPVDELTTVGYIHRYDYLYCSVDEKQKDEKGKDREFEYEVLSNGSLFFTIERNHKIRPSLDELIFDNNVIHFRRLYSEIIQKNNRFYCKTIGPSPLHSDIYFVFCKMDREKSDFFHYHFSHENDLYVIASADEDDLNLIFNFFLLVENELSTFYSLMCKRSEVINYDTELKNLFNDINTLVLNLHNIHWLRFIRRSNDVRSGKRLISKIYSLTYRCEEIMRNFSSTREEGLNKTRKYLHLQNLHSYFVDQTQIFSPVIPSFNAAIDNFRSEIESYSTKHLIIIASLLGAFVGALVTGVLTNYDELTRIIKKHSNPIVKKEKTYEF